MKKILSISICLFVIFLCFTPQISSSNSTRDVMGGVILWESFENGFPPENWTNTGWLDSFYGKPCHGNHWAYSWAFGDVLTTPPLEFGDKTTLTFWYRVESKYHPMSSEVYVNDKLVWNDYGYTHDSYEMATVNLDSFSGLNTIAFHGHLSGDFYGDLLDAITVTTLYEDVNQSLQDRGYPIRHALDGDWGAAQNFTTSYNHLAFAEIYLRKFGIPEFNLTVELRENHPQGNLIDTLIFTPDEVPSSWTWLELDFTDVTTTPGTDYFIVCPAAPSGITNSFGYEWGYAWGDQYWPGSLWFTRDGGGLWRDLPTMYEFTFKVYGSNEIYVNNPPVIGSPVPVNGSMGAPTNFTWRVPVYDSEGFPQWSVECSNGQTNSGTCDQYSSTALISLSDLSDLTWYTVWVNVTDGIDWTREWFSFQTESASTWTVLTYDDFEDGFGNYSDGGGDCNLIMNTTYAHQGSYSAQIQDNTGWSASFYYPSGGIDVDSPPYTSIRIDFWFIANSMEKHEDFFVHYYDGSSWHNVAEFDARYEFVNGQFYHEYVWINEAEYTFPTDMRIRFECSAGDNGDKVYFDQIYVKATG